MWWSDWRCSTSCSWWLGFLCPTGAQRMRRPSRRTRPLSGAWTIRSATGWRKWWLPVWNFFFPFFFFPFTGARKFCVQPCMVSVFSLQRQMRPCWTKSRTRLWHYSSHTRFPRASSPNCWSCIVMAWRELKRERYKIVSTFFSETFSFFPHDRSSLSFQLSSKKIEKNWKKNWKKKLEKIGKKNWETFQNGIQFRF